MIDFSSGSSYSACAWADRGSGCLADEKSEDISSDTGAICSPKCTKKGIHEDCPSDVPAGVKANPSCCFDEGKGRKKERYCGLICATQLDCGANMKCFIEKIPGDDDLMPHEIGYCYYPKHNETRTLLTYPGRVQH